MQIETINLYDLQAVTELSAVRCSSFAEAAAVCLARYHEKKVNVVVLGDLQSEFELVWGQVSEEQRNSYNDLEEATEDGAYCLAIWVIEKLTEYHTLRKSQKQTGIDFFLNHKTDTQNPKPQARLEVSGILKGTTSKIKARLNQKIAQSMQSDDLEIPAFIIIVEFSKPSITVKKR